MHGPMCIKFDTSCWMFHRWSNDARSHKSQIGASIFADESSNVLRSVCAPIGPHTPENRNAILFYFFVTFVPCGILILSKFYIFTN